MRKRERRLFFEVAYANCGSMRTALMALEYLVGWGRASDAAGWPQSVEEYAGFVGTSRSQAFRRQAAFRQCFPNDNIEVTWGVVRPNLDAQSSASKSMQMQAVLVGTLLWNPSRFAK